MAIGGNGGETHAAARHWAEHLLARRSLARTILQQEGAVDAAGGISIADTQVPAAVGQDGKTYFSPKAICEGLGIDWPSQRTKIMADVVLASTVVEIAMVRHHDGDA